MPEPYYDDEAVTLYHGDAFEILPALADARQLREVAAVIVDPPYGETSLDWDRWAHHWPAAVAAAVPERASMWCFGSFRMFLENAADFTLAGWQLAQEIVWEKQNGSGLHNDRFRRVHELAVQWYRGRWDEVPKDPPLIPDFEKRTIRRNIGPPHQTGDGSAFAGETPGGQRLQTSVIRCRNEHGRAVHPTQKPTGILTPLIRYSAPPGSVVLDPFAGSGSLAVAAKADGRRAICIEAHEPYIAAAAKRCAQGVLDL